MGGAVAAVENGYMKSQLVESNARRVEAIERGEQIVVGVNRFTETEPSPLAAGEGAILTVAPRGRGRADRQARRMARGARRRRGGGGAGRAARAPRIPARNIMPASIACAKAGVTTGEWGDVLRQGFGEYRAPTGVSHAARNDCQGIDDLRAEVERMTTQARTAAENPCRQARPRRPFQRRRAGRGAGARRRHGRGL